MHNFVLVANEYIEVTRSKFFSQGSVFCLSSLRRDPASHTGNLTAVGCITIDRENWIDGDVTAGGAIKLDLPAGITGMVHAHASVAPLNLPDPLSRRAELHRAHRQFIDSAAGLLRRCRCQGKGNAEPGQ